MNAQAPNPARPLHEVLAWTERMAEIGIYKANTARLRKSALEALLSILTPEEVSVVSPTWAMDHVDELGNRWANKNGGNPDTVRTYISRVKGLLQDYARYVADPKSFKPRSSTRSENASKQKKAKVGRQVTSEAESVQQEPMPLGGSSAREWRTFPLGKGRDLFKYSLPNDTFTAKDVLKIACHLVTLAEDFDPTSPAQAQMFALATRTSDNE